MSKKNAIIPVVDFSMLISTDPQQRSKALQILDMACKEWGFFVLINHGIPEAPMKNLMDATFKFFELPIEEKKRYGPKGVLDPIAFGTGLDPKTQALYWRDYLKINVFPKFYCPEKPQTLRESLSDYSKRGRKVFDELVNAISENLGLSEGYMKGVLNLDSCFERYVANYYPTCPEPEKVLGVNPHTDYGLLTLLIHNGVSGLQIHHDNDWLEANSPPKSILVNVGDHLQIFSNGRYKSNKHRVVVNKHSTRLSIILVFGSEPDTIVRPAASLVERDGREKYPPMKFTEFVEAKLKGLISSEGID